MLYPYLQLGTIEKEGVKWYAVFLVLGAFGFFGLYLYWLVSALGGGGGSARREVATQAVATVAVGSDVGMVEARRSVLRYESVVDVSTPVPVVVVSATPVASATPVVSATPVMSASRSVLSAVLVADVDGEVVESGGDVGYEYVGDVFYVSYWPDDGADWCLDYDGVSGRCLSPVTSGDAWRDVVGVAAACPAEWLYRELELLGVGRWRCLDTGPGARCSGGVCTVFLLQREYVIGLVPGYLW